ncbi:MAG: PAS domain S-box protein [Thermodesulfobacteriota bacterium]
MILSLFELPNVYKYLVMATLIFLSAGLSCYYPGVLGTGTVFTHFFYLPIVLACIWWKKKGLMVIVLLSAILLVSQHLFQGDESYADNIMRILIFFLVALVSILLSEGIEKARERANEHQQWYQTIFHNAGAAMAIVGKDAVISLVNAEFEHLTGYSRDELGDSKSLFEIISEKHAHKARNYYYHVRKERFYGYPNLMVKLDGKSGAVKDVRLTFTLVPGTGKMVATLVDLSQLKKAMEEQQRLKAELAETLAKVLSGYLPICSRCKKIKEDSGQWKAVETYIQARTAADFTHTLCPECARALYPELVGDLDDDKRDMIV